MRIRLFDIAHARSGDKGNTANIGVIARRPEAYRILKKYLTAERVKEHFAGICFGRVDRFELPNLGTELRSSRCSRRRRPVAAQRFARQDSSRSVTMELDPPTIHPKCKLRIAN
jgi:hypothetical protein